MRNPNPPATAVALQRQASLARPIAGGLNLPPPHLAVIEESHQRCAALGVSRIGQPDLSIIARQDLAIARERNRRLHAEAAPVMVQLHEQIVDSQSMVVLTDASGTVLHSIGDDDFLGRASKVALAPGANWSEQAKGTNAVGTALFEEQPVLVHADEHYLHANHFLTCSAAPILDPRGNILGVLDVSGDQQGYHRHTMALVRMSARMIENRWLAADAQHALRLHFHARADFIGTLMEGIVAVDGGGRLVGANRSALEQLGLSGAGLRMQTLEGLFGVGIGALVDRFRSPFALPLERTIGQGAQRGAVHLVARFDWPRWSTAAAPAAATASGAAAALPVAGSTSAAQAPSPAATGTAGGAVPGAVVALGGAGAAVTPVLDTLGAGDARFEAALARIRQVLDRDIPILLSGETGSGKAVLARAIHAASARAARPFVAVPCAAIAPDRIEAELFGHRGAGGLLARADGGTLFIDDVGELPLVAQGALLRVLQERQLALPGGLPGRPLALALVCATRQDLRQRIAAGQFREDLFYCLNGLTVRLPPLRERSDLAALARRWLQHEGGGRALRLAPEVLRLFARHRWPGNLRQLHNVLRTACAMVPEGASMLARRHLPEDFVEEALEARGPGPAGPAAAAGASGSASEAAAAPGPASMADLELEAIRRTLAECAGNVSAASKRLGISRNTIYRKLRQDPPVPAGGPTGRA